MKLTPKCVTLDGQRMIEDTEHLAQWRQRAAVQPKGRTVLDLEADSLHRHKERLCLIQYADADGVCVIDPLSIEDIRLFSDWLAESDVWMHGADYDMTLFLHTFGHLPHFIYDTQTAARFLGFRQFGLAALVLHFFGIELKKGNQKADWGRRPLSPALTNYAEGDVTYMLEMADKLSDKLHAEGRYDWFLETCAQNMTRTAERVESAQHDAWRIKGSGRLHRRGLAALHSLWTWRDNEAALIDKPSFIVCTNEQLIQWSNDLQEFHPVEPLPRFTRNRAARFRNAVAQFQAIDEDDYPTRIQTRRKTEDSDFDRRLKNWMERRDAAAERLDIEASFLAPRSLMESLARDEEASVPHLMSWQKELLGITL